MVNIPKKEQERHMISIASKNLERKPAAIKETVLRRGEKIFFLKLLPKIGPPRNPADLAEISRKLS